MSLSNLFALNNYPIKINEATIVDLDTSILNTDTFTVNGVQPPGTTLVSDGTKMANFPVGADGEVLTADSAQANGVRWVPNSPAGGDVIGPGSATDHSAVRFDGATGKLVEDSNVIIDDLGGITLGDNADTNQNIFSILKGAQSVVHKVTTDPQGVPGWQSYDILMNGSDASQDLRAISSESTSISILTTTLATPSTLSFGYNASPDTTQNGSFVSQEFLPENYFLVRSFNTAGGFVAHNIIGATLGANGEVKNGVLFEAATATSISGNATFTGTMNITGSADQDILVHDGTSFISLVKGTAGEVLRVDLAGTNLEWAPVGEGAGSNSIAIGNSASSTGANSGAIGTSASATQSNSWAIGAASLASGIQAISIGSFSDATGINSLAFGSLAQATNDNTTSLGANSSASGLRSIGIAAQTATGFGAAGDDSISIGNRAVTSANNGIAIGQNCDASQVDAIALGRAATTDIVGRFSVNPGSKATTVGAAGVAAALPATPESYWRVRIGEVNYKIPLYLE